MAAVLRGGWEWSRFSLTDGNRLNEGLLVSAKLVCL